MTVRMALLGAGRIGKVHAQAISGNHDAELVSVTDALPEAASAITAQHGGEVRTLDEVAAADDVDAVITCTPTNTHADLIEKFTRLGKAVFCEKPIDLNIERVRDCLKVVKDHNGRLMLGFNRRFDPHFSAVQREISNGRIGAVEQVTITSRDPGLPPADYIAVSGGMFRDMTIHDFDMARFLLGEEITTVQATASVLVDPEVEKLGDFDTATTILVTASGKQCTILNSRRATYGYDQRIEVHGAKGMLSAENHRPVSIEVADQNGFSKPPLHDFFMTRYTAAYEAEIAAFVATVRDGIAPSPSAEDGLMALALAEAALKSVAEQRVVQVSEVL